ncbi:polyketide synthase dehydratase domain-containing protein [Streptomyces sp. INA 01156]
MISSPRSSSATTSAPKRAAILHPALLDAALHPLLPGVVSDEGQPLLPFTWAGASVYAGGVSVLRVRLAGAVAPGPRTAARRRSRSRWPTPRARRSPP